MVKWSHPIITQGAEIEVHKLTLRGQRAVLEQEIAMLERRKAKGQESSSVDDLDLFLTSVFYALRPSLPHLSMDALLDGLEASDLVALKVAMKEAQGVRQEPPQNPPAANA